jgi:Predicted signal-transduction protein containing cAMP-binding and CBS domains
MAAPTITAGLKQLLVAHLPFSRMQDADLGYLIGNVEVVYFAPGETVLAPTSGPPEYCLIVKQGRVRGLLDADPGKVAFVAGVGDCFPVSALLTHKPVGLTYVAVGDTFCLRLNRQPFEELTRRSAPFAEFCQRRLGSMLELSRRELQATYAAQASAEHTMSLPLAELVRGRPVTCRPQETLRDAFTRMHEAEVGSIIVTETTGDQERVVGILTRTDLIGRVILPEVPLSTPIAEVMSTHVLTLAADDTAADATLLMAEHAIRHVPVMSAEATGQRLIGVVSERDLFALQRLSVRQRRRSCAAPTTSPPWPRSPPTSGVCPTTWSHRAWQRRR